MSTTLTKTKVTVGLGSCGIAAGGKKVYDEFEKAMAEKKLGDVALEKTSCCGLCFNEVIVEVESPGAAKVTYGNLTPKNVERIVAEHLVEKNPVWEWVVLGGGHEEASLKYLAPQKKIVLRRAGMIDPLSLDDYLATGGYEGLRKAITGMTPEEVIKEITDSGLRGRGGAGFPTGVKWQFARNSQGDQKYIICNGDEGDPGAFMDRSVMEGDPHSVLEGMAIAGYAIGADTGVIYCRAEYPLAVSNLQTAIGKATAASYLGKKIMGSDFNFNIEIRLGAGAFVCGEETALIASCEGRRGMPRLRPPFPAVSGFWERPTNINNVETLGNIAWIISNGAGAYNSLGTEKSKGTKVFALAGKIARGGLIEVPMGIPLKTIIEEIGGGTSSGRPVKAVQMGGPSGGCIPKELFDTPVDYDSITATGAIMGSGGMVVMDDTTCMVDIARFFLNFTQEESCGKCTFCRIGTKRMLEILNRICEGKGRESDLDSLQELAEKVKRTSLCGLGQTAPNPVLTTMKYFRHEYEAHIREKKCPAHYCLPLLTFSIDAEKCTGCGVCMKNCPSKAITGEKKEPHVISQETCIKCGECRSRCKFDAIIAV